MLIKKGTIMNAYDLLKRDHATIADIFGKLEPTTERAMQMREAVFERLDAELTLHAAIEEQIFYPALKQAAETHEIVSQAYEEHRIVKELLQELASMPKDSDEWTAKMIVLKENVEHHVEEEEGDLFKRARKVLTSEQAEELGKRLQTAKGEMASKARSSR